MHSQRSATVSPSVSLPTRRRTCSQVAASGAPDLGQSAWETGGLRSQRLRPHCMRTPSCMAFVVIGRGKDGLDARSLKDELVRLYHSGLASWIWTWCARGRTRGDSPPAGGPWEAWGSLMDLCGRFRPVGPPRSSCDAYVGRVCHCHCGSDRRSRHPVRLVWVNGSFGCRTIAARTRDLILDTVLAVTNSYSTVAVLLWDLGGPTCKSA